MYHTCSNGWFPIADQVARIRRGIDLQRSANSVQTDILPSHCSQKKHIFSWLKGDYHSRHSHEVPGGSGKQSYGTTWRRYMLFRRKETIAKLEDVLCSSWRILHQGVSDFRHPCHRAVLATMSGNEPEVRTVILRGFSEKDRELICHCDARTPKVRQIQDNPKVSWLFYHPKKWIQLRLSGTASIHTDDKTADSQWVTVRRTSRVNYSADAPPGSPVSEPTSGLPGFLRNSAATLFDNEEARKNFAVIVCRFDQMDWLMLQISGNLRATFHWTNNRVDSSWVVP